MSASQDKKRRRLERAQEQPETKQQRIKAAAKKRKQQQITRVVAIVTAVVVVAVIIGISIFSSAAYYRAAKAVEINDTDYTVADFNYYYYAQYYQYYNNAVNSYGDYAAYFLPNTTQPFASQPYAEDMTWADFFEQRATEYLKETTALYDEAQKNGFKLPDEAEQEIADTMAQVKATADEAKMSVNKYLSAMYGKGVNEKVYRRNIERVYYVSYYAEQQYDSYEYKPDELKAYYTENKNDLDSYTFRMFYLSVSNLQATDEKATIDDAKDKAKEFMAGVNDEASFIRQSLAFAPESSKESYEDAEYTLRTATGEELNDKYAKWLQEATRKEGDMEMFRADEDAGYYILYYIGREDNSYNTVDVRHILIMPETVTKTEDMTDEAFQKAEEEAKDKALTEAKDLLEQWQAGTKTEESFAKLADEKSDDSPEGGLYEQVYQNQMVEAFNDWCFDAKRAAGDVEIVETEYGYHIIYFVGENDPYCDVIADSRLRNKAYEDWKDKLVEKSSIDTTLAFSFVG